MRRFSPALALAALALGAYSNSFQGEFALDSRQLVLQDPRVHAATAESVGLILDHSYWWPYGESGLYRPATTLSYLVNFAVLGNGDHPSGYHWANFLLHVLNVLLLFRLALRLGTDPGRAWFMAAVWAVHPVLTESVTNIVGRSDLLSAMAVLAGLLMYVESREAAGPSRVAWLAGLAAVTTLGVFSKESAVTIVGVIALYEITWWRQPRSVAHLMRACAAVLPPVLVMGVKRSAVLAAAGPAAFSFTDNPIVGADFWVGRLTAVAVMGRSLWLVLWPVTLSSDYSYAAIPLAAGAAREWLAWATVALAIALTGAAWRWSRSAFFWVAFAFVTCLPTSNLVMAIGSIMAERFLYLPSVGVVACVVLGVFALADRSRVRSLAPAVLCVIILLFGGRTFVRNRDWQNDATLATATAKAVPASYKAHSFLAGALYRADPSHGNIDEVIVEAERAIAVIDALPDGQADGAIYLQAGRYYIEKGEQWRRDRPADQPAEVPLDRRGPYERALSLLRRAEAIGEAQRRAHPEQIMAPHFAGVYIWASVAHLRLGDPQRALDTAMRARRVAPLNPDVYARMAESLLAADRPDDAAIALTGGVMMTASQPLAQALRGLYRAGLDPDDCAVFGDEASATLNPRCPIVRRHVCTATPDALQLLLQIGRGDLAERTKGVALGPFGCPAAPLEAVLPGR